MKQQFLFEQLLNRAHLPHQLFTAPDGATMAYITHDFTFSDGDAVVVYAKHLDSDEIEFFDDAETLTQIHAMYGASYPENFITIICNECHRTGIAYDEGVLRIRGKGKTAGSAFARLIRTIRSIDERLRQLGSC